jgi:hypothetical protein
MKTSVGHRHYGLYVWIQGRQTTRQMALQKTILVCSRRHKKVTMPTFIKIHLTGAAVKQVGGRNKHEAGFILVSCLAYSSTLKTEATWSSKLAVDFQRTTYVVSQMIEPFIFCLFHRPQVQCL